MPDNYNFNGVTDADGNNYYAREKNYTTCDTAAGTAAKVADLAGFVLETGLAVRVKFTNSNTAANPTLNIAGTGAIPILRYAGTAAGTEAKTSWQAGAIVTFVYDGTSWIMADFADRIDTNTTYNAASASTAGLMSAADKTKVEALGNVANLSYTVVSTW